MQKIMGFTESGNTTLSITGAAGTISRKVQGSFPSCTITIYDAGTVNLASIYSDDNATPTVKANPFTAASDGTWFAYAANGRYDVRFSGGGIATPFTIGDFSAGVGAAGVPAYAFASLPTSKSQNAGNLARVTDTIRGLWVDNGTLWGHLTGRIVDVRRDFSAVGDGSADDTTPFTNALSALSTAGGGVLFCPRGEYRITAALSVPANVCVMGAHRLSTTISKRFSGDLMTLASGAGLQNISVDGGQSQGHTGRSIVVSTGLYQYIDQCELDNSDSYCVEYSAADAGSGGYIADSLVGGRADPYVAIKLPADSTASPRTFTNLRGGGAILFDFNGVNGCFVDNCFTNRLTWTGGATTSTNVCINNCRIAGAATTISGAATMMTGCVFAAAVTFDANSSSCMMKGCNVPNFDITDNGTGNRFDIPGNTYTSAWSQGGGAQPAIGNGTIAAYYTIVNRLVMVQILVTFGGTTTFGNNANAYRFSLPYAAQASSPTRHIGTAFIFNASPTTSLPYQCEVAAGDAFLTISDGAGGAVRSDSPITFASGDEIRIVLEYLR